MVDDLAVSSSNTFIQVSILFKLNIPTVSLQCNTFAYE